MITSYNPEFDPTYIDEGNAEMFVIEQVDSDGNVHQVHLAPNQAWELGLKLAPFLEARFGLEAINQARMNKLKEHGVLPPVVIQHSGDVALAA
jgi:hypothetical protein